MKDIDRALQACRDAGLVVSSGSKHRRVTDPKTGKWVSVSCTPRDPYAYRQVLRDVKRYLGHEVTL